MKILSCGRGDPLETGRGQPWRKDWEQGEDRNPACLRHRIRFRFWGLVHLLKQTKPWFWLCSFVSLFFFFSWKCIPSSRGAGSFAKLDWQWDTLKQFHFFFLKGFQVWVPVSRNTQALLQVWYQDFSHQCDSAVCCNGGLLLYEAACFVSVASDSFLRFEHVC